jgi:SAM-dependent methyltransferase
MRDAIGIQALLAPEVSQPETALARSELLIGCGLRRNKMIPNGRNAWSNLTTLDMSEAHKPDVVYDLEKLPLPFPDNSFDEIHAYDVMEHVGKQGDWRFFFAQWQDFWRLLKPDGLFCGISPHWSSPWAWGDPGHTRVISSESFVFLDQSEYQRQVGSTPMTDYRFCYQADLRLQWAHVDEEKQQLYYVLRAIKPGAGK